MKILQVQCLPGVCMKALVEALVEALGRFSSQDLVSSAPAAGLFLTILSASFFWDAHRKFLYEDLVSSSI